MDLGSVLVFAGALCVAAASPGPGIAAIVARVLGRGMPGAIAFTAGVAIGDVVWLCVAVLGLAAIAQSFHAIVLVIKYAGAAYLLWLAWKLWSAPVEVAEGPAPQAEVNRLRLFLGGLAVTLGNPKVMVFYLALLPNIVDLGALSLWGLAELSAVTLAVLAMVFGSYMVLADRARALLRSPVALRRVNRGSGLVMATAAVTIAAK